MFTHWHRPDQDAVYLPLVTQSNCSSPEIPFCDSFNLLQSNKHQETGKVLFICSKLNWGSQILGMNILGNVTLSYSILKICSMNIVHGTIGELLGWSVKVEDGGGQMWADRSLTFFYYYKIILKLKPDFWCMIHLKVLKMGHSFVFHNDRNSKLQQSPRH